MSTVLVTGATGLLGRSTVCRLVELGHAVVGYDLSPNLDNLGDVANDVRMVRGDVSDLPRLLEVMKRTRVERVVHTAAMLGDMCSPIAALNTNCMGTANVFEAAVALDVERVCWASSAGVYGRRSQYPEGQLLDEDVLLGPFTVYRATKVACEAIAMSYRESGLDVIGVRPVSSYGIGRLTGGGMAALHVAIREAALGRSAVFPATFGRPDDTWQPMYSKDVAATFIAATFVEETQHAIFNPPVRQLLTIQESLEILQSLVPDVTVTFGTDTSANVTGDLPLLDSSRVEKELGVTQEYDLSTGLAEMIDHYRSTTSESG